MILTHGIGDADTYAKTTGKLAQPLVDEGHNVMAFKWGPSSFWNVHKRARIAGVALADQVKTFRELDPGGKHAEVNVVAHSAGALVVKHAMRNGAKFNDVFLIAPAISRRPGFRWGGYDRVFCFHNCVDLAVLAGTLLPWHPFGSMGLFGFYRSRGQEFNLHMPSTKGRWNHSKNWFEGEPLDQLVDNIAQIVGQEFMQGNG